MSVEREMRTVLLRLELMSNGSTQAWNASGGQSGEPDDKVIRLVERGEVAPHAYWRERFSRCRSEGSKRAVLGLAEADLLGLVRRTAPRVEGKSDTELMLEDGEGLSAEVLAARFNVAASYVRRLRVRDGRGSEDGLRGGGVVVSGDVVERARVLRGRGLTTRQVALMLGVGQASVMRWTK